MDWTLIAYWVCFGVGSIYALVSAVLGGFFGFLHHAGGDLGGHMDMGHEYGAHVGGAGGHAEAFAAHVEGEPVISPLSPATISVFLATFGGIGIILTSLFKLNLFVTLPVSAGSGLLVASFVVVLFYHLFTKVQASSEARVAEAIGLKGEITVPIPKDGIGEVAYIGRGARLVSPARAQSGEGVPRHAAVRIVRQVGTTMYVELLIEGETPPARPDETAPLRD